MPKHSIYTILLGLKLLILPACSTDGTKQSRYTDIEQPASKGYFDEWMVLYKYEEDLIPKTKLLLDSIAAESSEEFEPLVRRIVDQLCEDDKVNLATVIAAYPYGIKVSPDEYSEIANRLLIQTRLPGNKAPAIGGLEQTQSTAMLVLFYESDCPNCHTLLDELITNYDSLQRKGIEIVSISSDSNPAIFKNNAARFPWKDKLCDYKSFVSPNFKRWGVAATPTMYLVDVNGTVKKRCGSLVETGLLM